jgi:hypothetical protein
MLFIMNPAPTSNTQASATSATTNARRVRLEDGPAFAPRAWFRKVFTSVRAA